MAVSKKDIVRVLQGEKRVRAWKEYIQANPTNNPRDKDGNIKPRGVYPRKPVEYVPEEVNREKAILSGGVTAPVKMRSADAKCARMARSLLDLEQGSLHVSKIDGHVYGSVQKVGRSLDEIAHDEGRGVHGALVGARKPKPYVAKPFAEPNPDSPFKVKGKRRQPIVVIKKG